MCVRSWRPLETGWGEMAGLGPPLKPWPCSWAGAIGRLSRTSRDARTHGPGNGTVAAGLRLYRRMIEERQSSRTAQRLVMCKAARVQDSNVVARVRGIRVLSLKCTATLQRDMCCARVLGHGEPLEAHELKNATLQGEPIRGSRPLETVVAQ